MFHDLGLRVSDMGPSIQDQCQWILEVQGLGCGSMVWGLQFRIIVSRLGFWS